MTQGIEHIPSEDSRKLVRNLAAMGTRYVDIAHKIEITDDTLRKHYKEELEGGRIDANAQIANTLFQQAKKGNMTAAIFWLKTRAGWKETTITELTGANGEKLITGVEITLVDTDGSKSAN